MRYLTNPMVSVRYKGKSTSRKRFHAAGFTRNPKPTKRQLAARKKFAAMARARAKAGSSRKRASSKGEGMARRKRKAGTRRRSTTRKRRSVSVRRRRVLSANPRRRRRHVAKRSRARRYHRNPGMGSIVGQTKDLLIGAGVGLVGMAAGRTLSRMIPFASTSPLVDFAKGTIVAIGIRVLGEKVLGKELARIAAIGAMLGPTKDLVLAFAPQAGGFLGDGVMAMPRFTSRPAISAYPGGVAGYSEVLGAYAAALPY